MCSSRKVLTYAKNNKGVNIINGMMLDIETAVERMINYCGEDKIIMYLPLLPPEYREVVKKQLKKRRWYSKNIF